MLMPCEVMIKSFLPAIRASITKELSSQHKWNQIDIAKELGVTQAAVSKYLSGKYANSIKTLEDTKEVKKIGRELALKISTKKASKAEVVDHICTSCETLSKEAGCKVNDMFRVPIQKSIRGYENG